MLDFHEKTKLLILVFSFVSSLAWAEKEVDFLQHVPEEQQWELAKASHSCLRSYLKALQMDTGTAALTDTNGQVLLILSDEHPAFKERYGKDKIIAPQPIFNLQKRASQTPTLDELKKPSVLGSYQYQSFNSDGSIDHTQVFPGNDPSHNPAGGRGIVKSLKQQKIGYLAISPIFYFPAKALENHRNEQSNKDVAQKGLHRLQIRSSYFEECGTRPSFRSLERSGTLRACQDYKSTVDKVLEPILNNPHELLPQEAQPLMTILPPEEILWRTILPGELNACLTRATQNLSQNTHPRYSH